MNNWEFGNIECNPDFLIRLLDGISQRQLKNLELGISIEKG